MAVELLPGNKVFRNQLTQMKRRCTNFQPAFAIIDRSFLSSEKKRWSSNGPGWAPLYMTTIRLKAAQNYDLHMLVRGEPGHTEGLKQSLTTHGSGSLYQVTPLSLTEGTSVTYAHFHQDGTSPPAAKRKIFPDIEEIVFLWFPILQAYFLHGAAAASVVGAAASRA